MLQKTWYHGSNVEITNLNLKGSGMNLWGSNGAYLTSEKSAARNFGEVISEFKLNSNKILNTEDEASYELCQKAMEFAKIPFMTFFNNQPENYGELIALMGEYTGGDRSTAVKWLQNHIDFDVIFTPNVSGKMDGKEFSEGDIIVVLSDSAVSPAHKPIQRKRNRV